MGSFVHGGICAMRGISGSPSRENGQTRNVDYIVYIQLIVRAAIVMKGGNRNQVPMPGRRAHTSLGIASVPEGSDGSGQRPFSDGEEPAPESIFAPPALSSLPEIRNYQRHQERAALSQKVKQGLLDPTQYYIYAESYGGVEFWRKMAKRAESAMQMEQKHYHSDRERTHDVIHRLRCRVSALEVMADEREASVQNQRRKIRLLRHQLQHNRREYEKELSLVRGHVDHFEKKFSVTNEECRRKMVDMKSELQKNTSTIESLQNHVREVVKCVEEPLATFYLPDYLEGRRRTEEMKLCAKILRVRVEHQEQKNDFKPKDDKIAALTDDVKALKRLAEETSKSRDSAVTSLKSYEGLFPKLEALDRILSKSPLLKAADLNISADRTEDKLSNLLNKITATALLISTKADGMISSMSSWQREKERIGSVIGQLKMDIDMKASDDNLAVLMVAREQLKKKSELLQSLQKDRASAEVTVGKNVSKVTELEKSIEELNYKYKAIRLEKDKLSDSNIQLQKEKSSLEKQLTGMQTMLSTLGESLQSGNTDAISDKKSKVVRSDEGGNILQRFKAMSAEKNQMEEIMKQIHDTILPLLQMLHKQPKSPVGAKLTTKSLELIEILPAITTKVSELKKAIESMSNKLRVAENDKGDVEKRRASQIDSTQLQINEICGSIRKNILKLQPVVGDTAESLKSDPPKSFTGGEISKLLADFSSTVPKVIELHKNHATAISKLRSTESQLESTAKYMDSVRERLKGLYILYAGESGKQQQHASEAEELTLIDKVKQELLSSRDTKQKAVGRAQSLSLQVSLLDPILNEICGTMKAIEVEIGATSVPFKGDQETSGKLAFIRERLLELKGLISMKIRGMLDMIGDFKDKVKVQEEVIKNSEKKWSERVAILKKEVFRLGGTDLEIRQEKTKRVEAAQRVLDFIVKSAKKKVDGMNPFVKLASFDVDLLVNSKVHQQLEVGGNAGGLYQAAIHYFKVEGETGEITFENATIPGSQSSNMLVELVLIPAASAEPYESKAGDVLGLSIKVRAVNDQKEREILFNSNVIHTDEVMDAIKGQTLDNFSLWPDLVSSWKWERSPTKGWTLICIKWRFLLKSIFPEVSDPLQTLAIANRPTYDRSQTITTL